jgi:EmrB/QacA subfamily drug resistance transporter
MTGRAKLVLATICVAQLILAVDVTIVQIANASIERSLGFSEQDIQWVFSAYALTFGGFLLLGGRISDLLGRRRLFIIGMATFAGTSLLAGLSRSPTELVVSRAAQGLAAAIVSPTALALVATSFAEGRERHRAYAVWGTAGSAGGAIGYVLGGTIVGSLGWRWAFFINPPIAGLTIVSAALLLPRSEVLTKAKRLDPVGALSITVGAALLIYGMTEASTAGWGSSPVWILTLSALASFAIFIGCELRVSDPILPFRLLRRRAAFGNVSAFLLVAVVNATIFLASLYQQQILHYSATRTGLSIAPIPVGVALGANYSPRFIARAGPRATAILGLSCVAASLVWMAATLDMRDYLVTFLPGWLVFGFGLSFAMVPLLSVSTSGVVDSDQGATAGVYNMAQQLGSVIGLAALSTTAVSIAYANRRLGPAMAEASGIHVALAVAAGISIAAVLTTLVTLPNVDVQPVVSDSIANQPAAVPEPG